MSTWIITGASTGLGRLLTAHVLSEGHQVVATAMTRFGGIDVLVNNAGIDVIGAVEEQDEADDRAVFEVNFFAAVALTRDVLPTLRAQRSGLVINVSSMDGIASLPANG
ncbi:MAG: SDR family NAD(P)-dependent oxidoreductase, partial [Nocardioides sp.]